MRRREFISLLGGAALVSPVAVRAQQAMPVVGYISGRDALTEALVLPAFRQGLTLHGFVEGRNVTVHYRYVGGQFDRVPAVAAELVNRGVGAVVVVNAETGGVLRSVMAATKTTPIVFLSGNDPVARGYVSNLARPGGNVTGVTSYLALLGTKRLGLLRELNPGAKKVAVLVNPESSGTEWTDIQEVA